jgi:hypothetical protein
VDRALLVPQRIEPVGTIWSQRSARSAGPSRISNRPDASGRRSRASSEPACIGPSKNSKLMNAALPSVPLIR